MLPSIEDLARMRRELNISQLRLAKLANVSQSLIAKMERGRVDPSYASVKKIYEALLQEFSKRNRSLTAKDICHTEVISVDAESTVRDAARQMHEHSFSQIPILSGGKVVGSITEDKITYLVAQGRNINQMMGIRVREIMDDAFPQVDENLGIELIANLLQFRKAILVVKHGDIIGIITKADLLKAADKRG
jgi:predicted transcriptional regulator